MTNNELQVPLSYLNTSSECKVKAPTMNQIILWTVKVRHISATDKKRELRKGRMMNEWWSKEPGSCATRIATRLLKIQEPWSQRIWICQWDKSSKLVSSYYRKNQLITGSRTVYTYAAHGGRWGSEHHPGFSSVILMKSPGNL